MGLCMCIPRTRTSVCSGALHVLNVGKCTGAHQCVIHFQEGFYPCKVCVRAFAVQYICDIVNVVDCGIVDGLWLTLARSWYITIAFEVDQ